LKSLVLLLTVAMLAIPASAPGQTPSAVATEQTPGTPPPTDPAVDVPPHKAADEDRWRLSLAIPVWLVGVDGDLNVRGHKISGDQDTADDVDELFDSRLNGAMALHFEAQKSRFGLLLDGMYLDRSIRGTEGATDAEATLLGYIGEVGGIYTVIPPAPGKRGWGMLRLDALVGLRISGLELGVETDTFSGDVSDTYYDPYVGGRVEVGLTNWLSAKARGDVGGFGIDAWNTSQFSYNVDTGLEFHFTRWFDLGLGYRWLSYDIDLGSESSLNATLSGPVVELKFNF